jgi:hypothetical protein
MCNRSTTLALGTAHFLMVLDSTVSNVAPSKRSESEPVPMAKLAEQA